MSTGAQHYAEGERLIELVKRKTNVMSAEAERAGENPRITIEGARAAEIILSAARTHFAAAQAAATILAAGKLDSGDTEDWQTVLAKWQSS